MYSGESWEVMAAGKQRVWRWRFWHSWRKRNAVGRGGSVISSDVVLLFSSLVCALVATVSLNVAIKERRRGSAFWLLPGVFGVLLVIACLVRVMIWAR